MVYRCGHVMRVQYEAMGSNVDTTVTRAKTIVNAASAVRACRNCFSFNVCG